METIITIRKNKPAFKALILLANELEKNDHKAISIVERTKQRRTFELITPVNETFDQESYFNKLSDFSALDELGIIVWPKISKALQPQ